jgi:excisionase family DNA binding protein
MGLFTPHQKKVANAGDEAVTPAPTPRLAYRIDEAAERVGVSRVTIYKLIAAGKLKAIKIGRCTVIKAAVLDAFLDKGAML